MTNSVDFILTVRLCANYADAIVTVQQIGTHACGFNGFKTQKDVRFVAKHNDHLELLYGRYAYKIEFNPPPATANFITRKRSYQLGVDESESKSKMLKLDDCSAEKTENNSEEEAKLFSNGAPSDETTPSAGCSMHLKENDSDSNVTAKWETLDGGKLMIYTAASVQNRSKVIFTADL